MAIANRKAGNKFPISAETIIRNNLFRGTCCTWKTANGRNTSPAEKMRIVAICQPLNALVLCFIRIKELPQIKESRINIDQLMTLSLFITRRKIAVISVYLLIIYHEYAI
jgi:hypothetical protein